MFLFIPNFVTMIFTMVTICYILFLLYIKVNNYSDGHFYIALCTFATVWSFGKGIMYSALTADHASIWYATSIVGYILVLSILMHYLMQRVMKKMGALWQGIFIYVPAIVLSMFVLGNTFVTSNYYQMSMSIWGWTRTSSSLGNDVITNIYFLICTIMGLMLLYIWRSRESGSQKYNHIKDITKVFWVVAVLTIILRYLFFVSKVNVLFDIGPLLVLLPASITAYYIEKRNHNENVFRQIGTEAISAQMKVFLQRYIAVAFALGGVGAFAFEYFLGGTALGVALVFGVIIGLIGIALKAIFGSKLHLYVKDTFVAYIMALLVPFLMFFGLLNGNSTIWPTPMIFMVAFILYNNSSMIIGMTISMVISYVAIGLIVPVSSVTIDGVDLFLRVFLTFLCFVVSFTVNRFYISTLEENARQAHEQEFINEVTSMLVKINYDEFQGYFESVLKRIGKHFGAEKVYFFKVDDEEREMLYKFGWSGVCDQIVKSNDHNIKFEDVPQLFNEIKDDGTLMVNDVTEIVHLLQGEKDLLDENGIKSIYGVSVYSESKMIGYLGMESLSYKMKLNIKSVYILKILGNVLCDAISRNKAEQVIREMAYHDYLTGLPNRAKFFNNLDLAIETSNEQETGILVGLVDLDNFKLINDTFGHEAGDAVLKLVAERLLINVKDSDMVCRFGGDEFLLYFYGVNDEASARKIGQKLLDKFSEPVCIKNHELLITLSLGLYLNLNGDTNISRAIGIADKAMYLAKQNEKKGYNLMVSDGEPKTPIDILSRDKTDDIA